MAVAAKWHAKQPSRCIYAEYTGKLADILTPESTRARARGASLCRSLVRIIQKEAKGEEGNAARGPPPAQRRTLPTSIQYWTIQRASQNGPSSFGLLTDGLLVQGHLPDRHFVQIWQGSRASVKGLGFRVYEWGLYWGDRVESVLAP